MNVALSLPATAESTPPLSAAQVQQLHRDGFLVVPRQCDDAELQDIRSMLMALFAQQAGRREGNHFDMLSLDGAGEDAIQPQIVKPSLYAPGLLRTEHFRCMQAMAEQLLGPGTQLSFDHSILKPDGKVAATPWHQDEAHGHNPDFHQPQISFWMPLQDVSEANGCMRYIPASNHGPLLPHRSLNDDPRIHAIECPAGYFDETAAVARPVPAGTCILHEGRTLHAAWPNRGGADRLAYVLAFRGPPVPRPEPVRFEWLDGKRTASLERSQRWRSRGGAVVLLARRLRRVRVSDPGTWGPPGEQLRRRVYEWLWAPRLKLLMERVPVIRRVYNGWLRPHPFDVAHGVDTSGFMTAADCASGGGVAVAQVNPYAASQPSVLRASLASLPDLERYSFVDIGCGKGRPLVLASEFPFQRVVGVELSSALAEVARANAGVVARRHPGRTPIEILVGDAVALSARPGGLLGQPHASGAPPPGVVYFLYHSFGRALMQALVENLEQHLRQSGQQAFFMGYNPVHGDVLDRSPAFARWSAQSRPYASDELGHGPDIEDTVVIWQSVPERHTPRPGADRRILVSASQWCRLDHATT